MPLAEDSTAIPSFQAESSTFVYQQAPGQPILWPLEHEQEAMLLQHYIENVALFVSNTTLSPIPLTDETTVRHDGQ